MKIADLHINQIVRGVVAGRFVVLAFRVIGGERMVQVKPISERGEPGYGEFALPPEALRFDA